MAMTEILLPTDLSYFNTQHPLVISPDPLTVAGDKESPFTQLACFRRSCICKYGQMWGLFTEMCYSHQTGLVKTKHVVLLLKHPRDSKHQADMACISSSVSSFSSPLPGTPHYTPTFSFLLGPHKSYYMSHHSKTNPVCHSSMYPKPFCVVSGLENLSAIYPLCIPTQLACNQSDHT